LRFLNNEFNLIILNIPRLGVIRPYEFIFNFFNFLFDGEGNAKNAYANTLFILFNFY